MLSKAVNGETTTFEYGNAQWQDQLTSVNGKVLTYDANGNLQSYDGAEYTWSHGKQLSSITKGDTTYEYQYDLNGIRSYKTVNGVTTKFDTLNGKILAQSDKNNKILFQYNGDTPIGFELNGTQYFYLTNLSGDVVGITDADGNLIAEYSYDEWGKLLNIETAEVNNAEQLAIAETNPLRYRGYYYDAETGMYYLQSRYYNPELCRFISADSFSFVNNRKELNVNAYTYCINDPVNYIDPFGNAYVSEAGKAVCDFIAIMFVSLEAEARGLGEDFVYLIASYFTNHVDDLYYKRDKDPKKDAANKRKSKAQFEKIFDELLDGFVELAESTFYQTVKAICPDFFFEFFERSVEEHSDFATITADGKVIITFGYGEADGFYSFIQDIIDRHIKCITIGDVDLGAIIGPDIGIYIEHQKEIANKFFASFTIEIELDFKDLFPHNPGGAVNTDFVNATLVSCVMVIFVLLLGKIGGVIFAI